MFSTRWGCWSWQCVKTEGWVPSLELSAVQSAHPLGFLARPPEKHLEGNLVGSCVSWLGLLTQCHRRGSLNN